jgi:hypothetical protein
MILTLKTIPQCFASRLARRTRITLPTWSAKHVSHFVLLIHGPMMPKEFAFLSAPTTLSLKTQHGGVCPNV